MAIINPHTTRATGTVLTAAIYNADHQNHITNANSLNADLTTAQTAIIANNTALDARLDFLTIEGAPIVAAATTDLATATGRMVHITGNTGITSFGIAPAGTEHVLIFDGTPIITHNAVSLILPGDLPIQASPDDVMKVVSEGGGNWRATSYLQTNEAPFGIGNYVPSIAFGGASVGVTYGSQVGAWTRVGYLYYTTGSIILTSKGSSVGAVTILCPAMPVNFTGGHVAIKAYSNMSTAVPMWLDPQAASKTLALMSYGATGGAALTNTNINNTTNIHWAGWVSG